MTSKRQVLRQQRRWAEAHDLAPGSRGYVGPEVGFEALSYQDLFRRLRTGAGVDSRYLAYLEDRYANGGRDRD